MTTPKKKLAKSIAWIWLWLVGFAATYAIFEMALCDQTACFDGFRLGSFALALVFTITFFSLEYTLTQDQ